MRNIREICLEDAVKAHENPLISFIGSGGKTTVMLEIFRGLLRRDLPAAATTSTRMLTAEARRFGPLIPCEGGVPAELPQACFLYERFSADGGKIFGPAPGELQQLMEGKRALLCEADGSMKRPLKCYKPHEPVLGGFEKRVVVVAGVDALGRPRSGEFVYRLEEESAEPVDADFVCRLIAGEGGYASRASSAGKILVLNGIDTEERCREAAEIGERLGHLFLQTVLRGPFFGIDEEGFYRSGAEAASCFPS